MFLEDFFHTRAGHIVISAEQASRFAKDVAGDFNPIHDPGARRFYVPGDLLCALVLVRHGLSQRMSFRFVDRVSDGQLLDIPDTDDDFLPITDDNGRSVLEVVRSGSVTHDPALIEQFIREYVAFSGRNFPHYLQPLMQERGVMFHPDRPLIMYDRMDFTLADANPGPLKLEYTRGELEVHGKRGEAILFFEFRSADGKVVRGEGSKTLVISGLRPYDPVRMESVVDEFNRRKAAYLAHD